MQTALGTGSGEFSEKNLKHFGTDRTTDCFFGTKKGPGPILENKGMGAIFHKKCKKYVEKGQNIQKVVQNWRKCTKFANYFKKGILKRAVEWARSGRLNGWINVATLKKDIYNFTST